MQICYEDTHKPLKWQICCTFNFLGFSNEGNAIKIANITDYYVDDSVRNELRQKEDGKVDHKQVIKISLGRIY